MIKRSSPTFIKVFNKTFLRLDSFILYGVPINYFLMGISPLDQTAQINKYKFHIPIMYK